MRNSNQDTHRSAAERWAAGDVAGWCDLFRPDDSTYIDPIFGEYTGRTAIRRWLVEVMGRAGRWRSSRVAEEFFDGSVAAGESELVIPLEDRDIILPFAWIQRYEDGFIVYRRDYYDTEELRRAAPAAALHRPEQSP